MGNNEDVQYFELFHIENQSKLKAMAARFTFFIQISYF